MKFSITIPAYKAQYLAETIKSVISQTNTNWELIIVDDCSPENLYTIVEPYKNDSRIRYYRNKANCGAINVVDNWNICLNYCTGDYVICMGDDDRLKPTCLEAYTKLIKQYPHLSVYHTRTEIINEQGQTIGQQSLRPEWESAISLLWNRWDHRSNQYIGDFCYDIVHLRAVGGYYKLPLAWGSDDITAVRAARLHGIANTTSIGFEYRQNNQTITNSNNARIKLAASMEAYNWFNHFLQEMQTTQLSNTDKEMLCTIVPIQKKYYYKSLGKNCTDDIQGKPMRILFWWKALRPFHFSPFYFAKWYIKSLINFIIKNK